MSRFKARVILNDVSVKAGRGLGSRTRNVHICGEISDKMHHLYRVLKHTTTFFSLSDHYILSREWRVIVDLVQTNYHGRPMILNQSGVTELLIMRDFHYGIMCFKSVKTLGALHS